MHRNHRGAALAASTLGLLALLAGPAWGQDVGAADRNGDGEVDRREFEERMVDVFFMMDTDKDGGLVPAELPRASDAVFSRADRNRDGKLQIEEFLEARAADFERADSDDDGRLDALEASAYDAAEGT